MKYIAGLIFGFILIFSFKELSANDIVLIEIDAGIGPATAEYISNSIEYAEDIAAEGIIIQLNTPGGLLEATRDIVQYILAAKIPVIVYVAPGGARAGSAGVFITLAANIAIMAPGTNIGAAHPVGLGGGSDTSSVMTDKVTNDASAFMRSIAQKRGKNVEWAERTVRESISATENEALDSGAIDFICPNIDSLLIAIDGLEVETALGTVTINSKKAEIIIHEKDWRSKFLGVISDPNIAYILMLLGIYGIFFELYNPGAIFPGVVGAISILLASYSLQMLPINYSGLALILLSIILFLIEIKVSSFGLLTVGGIVSFVLGSIMLIDSPFEFLSISMSLIITAAILTTLFFVVIVALGLKAQTRKKASGHEALIGEIATSTDAFSKGKKGSVKVHGELWTAISNEDIAENSEVIVTGVKGLKIEVKLN